MSSQPSSHPAPLTAEQWAAKAYAALQTVSEMEGASAIISDPIARLLNQAPVQVAVEGIHYYNRAAAAQRARKG